jgi:hypothetical protein
MIKFPWSPPFPTHIICAIGRFGARRVLCTLVILRRPGHDWPVIVGANRDEMLDRPWRPPARHWPDRPEVVAGLDLLAGGSWLGLSDFGVIAGILNRTGSLGPAPGRRSRGELVLEALDHEDAAAAAAALAAIDPRAYRTFNLILADNRNAFWLSHADPAGIEPVRVTPIPPGVSMIAAGDLNDASTPRIARYRPRFTATAPVAAAGDWARWESLLEDGTSDPADAPASAMRFATATGFGTVSSALIALPGALPSGRKPVFRFATQWPEPQPWRTITD